MKEWQQKIQNFLALNGNNRMKIVLITVGSIINGDDGAGPFLYQKYFEKLKNHSSKWIFVNAETMPENYLKPLINWNPSHIIFIDAVETNELPGNIIFFDESTITTYQILSTHQMPLILLATELHKHINVQILFIGIQEGSVDLGINELSLEVEQTVDSQAKFFSIFILEKYIST